jgi:hypothetical protein
MVCLTTLLVAQATYHRMRERLMNWKGCVRKLSLPNLRLSWNLCGGTEEIHENPKS